jgi:ribulose-phosphate 3-epimerase
LTINPDIPAERLVPYLDKVDMVLIMSVFAGFGGQKFIPESLDKIRFIKEEITKRGLSTLIEVDGGVSIDNAATLFAAGADVLVAGSAVFGADSPTEAIRAMKA